MIDTIRFRIPLSDDQAFLIKRKSVEVTKYDHVSKTHVFQVYRTDLHLGSFDRNINIFFSDSHPDRASLEFSVPKYFYGHNVYLFYLGDFHAVISELYSNLCKYFGDFPKTSTWTIQRLDVCYAWKFQTQEIAAQVLSSLEAFKYPLKQKHGFNTSLMLSGDTYSLKWYLKHPEYYAHDFKALLVSGETELAHQMEAVSQGVLRFEVSMRRKCLAYWLEKRIIRLDDIDENFCVTMLDKYFKKFFNGVVPQFMNSQEVFDKLLRLYKPQKARALYFCYLCLTSKDEQQKIIYRRATPKSTRAYHKAELKRAEVGINDTDFNFGFDFGIPSDFAVNHTNPTPCASRAKGGAGVQ